MTISIFLVVPTLLNSAKTHILKVIDYLLTNHNIDVQVKIEDSFVDSSFLRVYQVYELTYNNEQEMMVGNIMFMSADIANCSYIGRQISFPTSDEFIKLRAS